MVNDYTTLKDLVESVAIGFDAFTIEIDLVDGMIIAKEYDTTCEGQHDLTELYVTIEKPEIYETINKAIHENYTDEELNDIKYTDLDSSDVHEFLAVIFDCMTDTYV